MTRRQASRAAAFDKSATGSQLCGVSARIAPWRHHCRHGVPGTRRPYPQILLWRSARGDRRLRRRARGLPALALAPKIRPTGSTSSTSRPATSGSSPTRSRCSATRSAELTPAERALRERTRLSAGGIGSFATDPKATVAAFALGGTLYRADLRTGEVQPAASAGRRDRPAARPDRAAHRVRVDGQRRRRTPGDERDQQRSGLRRAHRRRGRHLVGAGRVHRGRGVRPLPRLLVVAGRDGAARRAGRRDPGQSLAPVRPDRPGRGRRGRSPIRTPDPRTPRSPCTCSTSTAAGSTCTGTGRPTRTWSRCPGRRSAGRWSPCCAGCSSTDWCSRSTRAPARPRCTPSWPTRAGSSRSTGTPTYLPDGRVLVGGELAHDGYDARCLFADGTLVSPPALYVRRVCGRLDGGDLIVEATDGEPSEQHLFRVSVGAGMSGVDVARLTSVAGLAHRGGRRRDARDRRRLAGPRRYAVDRAPLRPAVRTDLAAGGMSDPDGVSPSRRPSCRSRRALVARRPSASARGIRSAAESARRAGNLAAPPYAPRPALERVTDRRLRPASSTRAATSAAAGCRCWSTSTADRATRRWSPRGRAGWSGSGGPTPASPSSSIDNRGTPGVAP